ncbi:MAG: restriction endonuclease subunit S [Bacteroidaceae bacterium]|nr:restriction endonuclease subunit S [Bacteroidaceae bacterium]
MEPKIRLKGFFGEWKENTIGDISTSFSGGTPSAGVAKYYGGNIPFIRSGEISETKTQLFITEEGLNSSSARMVEKGTLLYALYGATSGEVSISKINGAINQAILAIYPKKGYSPEYISHYLRAKKENIVSALLQGGQGNLSGALVKGIRLYLPKTFEEQKAIANYLGSFDSLIQTTSKKIESLKQVKAASLQLMFPQEGETTPRVRFKGFEGEWKSVILGEVGFMTAGGTPSTFNPDFWGGSINWLQSGAIQNCIIYPSAVEKKITEKGLNQSSAYLIRKESILVAITGATCANIGFLTFSSAANQSVVSIETYEDFDSMFIYQNLLTERNQILSFKGGSAQSGVTLGSLKKVHIKVPNSKDEQKIIGEYFSNLDSQISFQTQRLEKLKQIKSACLDNMFV